MYNPALGRFMQPDPIGYYDSMNLYQYCLNNPINYTDPMGLFPWDTGDFIGAIIGGGVVGGVVGTPVGSIPGWGVGAIGGGLGYVVGWGVSSIWDVVFGDPDNDEGNCTGSTGGNPCGDAGGGVGRDWDGGSVL